MSRSLLSLFVVAILLVSGASASFSPKYQAALTKIMQNFHSGKFVPSAVPAAPSSEAAKFVPSAFTYAWMSSYSDANCANKLITEYVPLGTCVAVTTFLGAGSLMTTCSTAGVPTLYAYLGSANCSGTPAFTSPSNVTCNLQTTSTMGGSQNAGCMSGSLPSLTSGMASANVYADLLCTTQLETAYVTVQGVGKCQAQNGTVSELMTICSASAVTSVPYSGTTCTGTAGGPIINVVNLCVPQPTPLLLGSLKATGIMCPSSALGLVAAAAKIGLLVFALVALALIL